MGLADAFGAEDRVRKQESFLALRLKLWRLREELQKRLSLMENRKRL